MNDESMESEKRSDGENQPSEEMQAALRALSEPSEEMQAALRVLSEPSEEMQAALREFSRPSDKLVPETVFDDEDEERTATAVGLEAVPASTQRLRSIFETAGRDCTVESISTPDGPRFRLTFSLPAGRDERVVVVDDDGASALVLDDDLLSWRSLTHYNGIWNEKTSVVEVAVQGERFALGPQHWLRRLDGTAGEEDEPVLEVREPNSPKRLLLGLAGARSAAILGQYRLARNRRPLTVRLEGYEISTTEEADALAERVTDAFFFDIEMNRGPSMVLVRLESHVRPRRWGPETRRDPSFPRNRYPHAPRLLYRLGRDRSLPPVIRYWALYQVLEYFFPTYANEDAMRRLRRHLRSPTFDPHRDEDIVRAISLAGRSATSGEREDLASTLEAITSSDELRTVIEHLDLEETLRKGGRELSAESVNPDSDDLVRQLARRIYDVRCKIVHSKGASAKDLGPGLLAGTSHDDLIQPELPLLEYLAQQAIVASAEPLR